MPYTWMGNEHAAAAPLVMLAIPRILEMFRKAEEPPDEPPKPEGED